MIVSFYEKYAIKTCIFIFSGSNPYRKPPNYRDVSIRAALRTNVTKVSMRSKQITYATIKHYNNHLSFRFQSSCKIQFVFDVDNPFSEKLVTVDPNHNYHIRIYITGDQRGSSLYRSCTTYHPCYLHPPNFLLFADDVKMYSPSTMLKHFTRRFKYGFSDSSARWIIIYTFSNTSECVNTSCYIDLELIIYIFYTSALLESVDENL